MTDKRMNILERINEVRKEVTYVQKDKKQGMKYSIVSHDVVTGKLRASFVNHGIVYFPHYFEPRQTGNRTELWGYCRFACIDDKSDFIDVYTGGYGIDEQDKGPGKAISYACKYALLKVIMLETGDDPDLDQNVVMDNPDDVHMVNIKDFEAAVEAAATVADLEQTAKDYGAYMRDAEAVWSGRVAAARTTYQQKIHTLRKKKEEPKT